MIPLKLHIKNFLSYGSEVQTIDFQPHHLICLSGKNGHGKSALLDAMTWAVWGHARKVVGTNKADYGLLRLGQKQMSVIFDFQLSDQQYRVKREYSIQQGKAYSSLEFGTVDVQRDRFVPLTGKSIRATQEKIEKTVRIDFDCFCNSAFLRQGQANEFSKKTSKDRKQVLTTILGLDQFDRVRKQALDKVKEASTQKHTMVTFQEKLTQEIKAKKEALTRLDEINTQESELQKTQTSLNDEQKNLDEHQKIKARTEQENERLLFTTQQLEKQREELAAQFTKITNLWRHTHRAQRNLPEKPRLEAQKKEIEQAIQFEQNRFNKALTLKEKYLQYKERYQAAYTQAQQEYQTKLSHHASVVAQQQQAIKAQESLITQREKEATTFAKDLKELNLSIEKKTAEIKAYPAEEQYAQLSIQFEKRKEYYQQYISLGNSLRSQLNSITQRDALMQTENPSCPLCDQNLSAARRKFLKQQFAREQHTLEHKLRRISQLVPKLKILLLEQHKALEAAQSKKEAAHALRVLLASHEQTAQKYQAQLTNLSKQIKEMRTQYQKLIQTHKELEKQKALCTFTIPEAVLTQKKALEKLEKQLNACVYNSNKLQEMQAHLTTIEQQLKTHTDQQSLHSLQAQRMQDAHELAANLKECKTQIATARTQLAALEKQLQQSDLKTAQKQLAQKQAELQTKKELLLEQKATCMAQLKTIEERERELKQQEERIQELNVIIQDYQIIATATGKDGVQALLIEEAIPEIEQEANEILARLTDNQTQLFIESLRDLKKGGSKETLDIKISDPSGVRPYELFSGGEAFRIDFALRIAISKLLARRAGTALQTLIIDEGFGSQDEEGLGHIMDALYKIQDDFAKIIIVSHLPSLKEQFPIHFVVEKRPFGSYVSVVENG